MKRFRQALIGICGSDLLLRCLTTSAVIKVITNGGLIPAALPLADCCHVIDLARMVLGDPDNPKSTFCAGGRVLYNDARDIPDNQTITYDFGEFPNDS